MARGSILAAPARWERHLPWRRRLACLLLLGLAACSEQETRVLTLRIRVPEFCPEPGRPRYPMSITALGDFPDGPDAHALLETRSAALSLPPDTRAVLVEAAGKAWQGVGEVVGDQADVLLWPSNAVCPLSGPGAYPKAPGGHALGFGREARYVLLAGGEDQSDAVGALALDVATGQAVGGDDQTSTRSRRAFASVTGFGGDLLVAGGLDATDGAFAAGSTSAAVFSVRTGSFEPEPIELGEDNARARHGALTLRNGQTLLAGGIGPGGQALASVIGVSPETRRASGFQLESLDSARVEPVLLQLDDGRVVVAGGSTIDGELERPCASIEWFSEDASTHTSPPPLEFRARFDRAFVAMPGGGILAVGGCEDRAPEPDEDCRASCPRRGCPPVDGFDAEWISPEGVSYAFGLDFAAPEPLLIQAADGAPWLSADGRWWRFNPWQARFEAAIDAPDMVPERLVEHDDGPALAPRPVAIDPGAFVWLSWQSGAGTLVGFRHATRTALAQDLELIGNTDPLDALRPLHLAPDRAPIALAGETPPARFLRDDLGRPALELGFGWVVVADTEYADFDLRIELESGPRPSVRIGRDELGGPGCRWPEPAPGGQELLVLQRRAGSVELIADTRARSCNVSPERAPLALRSSGAESSVIRRLELTRTRSER